MIFFKKLCFPTPVNPTMPYNVPFSISVSAAPSYQPLPEAVHQLAPMNNHPSLQPQRFNDRLHQLERIVTSLIGENDNLKSRIEKLEGPSYAKILEDMGFVRKEQSPFPKSSRGNFCVHNDYVVYVYKNGYPKVNVEHFNSNETAKAIKKWKDDMKKNVSNFDTADDMIVEYDDGTVMKCRCKLCGEQFVIDRRLIRPNKQ